MTMAIQKRTFATATARMQHVEKKLMSLLPEKERKKIARLASGPDPAEEAEAEADLMSWTAQIKKEDDDLKSASAARDTSLTERVLPPVRGANGVAAPKKRRKPKPNKEPVMTARLRRTARVHVTGALELALN